MFTIKNFKMIVHWGTCKTCREDKEFQTLKKAINLVQGQLRMLWAYARSSHTVSDKEIHVNENYHEARAKDVFGNVTLIPSYKFYVQTWSRCMLQNPLQYDWLKFDMHCAWDKKYLLVLSDTIDEQMAIWLEDTDTRECHVFKSFTTWANLIRELLYYVATVEETGFNKNTAHKGSSADNTFNEVFEYPN